MAFEKTVSTTFDKGKGHLHGMQYARNGVNPTLDLGGNLNSGMHVSSVYRVRQQLGLDSPGAPVKVIELGPYQMLGEIAPDLMERLGVDVTPLEGPRTLFDHKKGRVETLDALRWHSGPGSATLQHRPRA